MTVGLLVCDHVRPGFQVVAGDYPDFFRRLLPGVEIITYDLLNGQFPTDLDECQAYLTTGSRHFVADDLPWLHRLCDLVRDLHRQRRLLVGICFGAQMIAHALGGEVGRAPDGWAVGTRKVEVVGQEWWMTPPAGTFRILHSNADQVKTLPEEARLLGRSAGVPINLFAVGDHFLGFQGHPEFLPEYLAVLMESRRGTVLADEVVDAGLASLGAPDTQLLASWITTFINRE